MSETDSVSFVACRSAHPKLHRVTGVILAGGRSSRYGKNKAFVPLDGIPLIERVVRVMGSVFSQLAIITNTPEEYAYLNVPMTSDLVKGIGPFGGIYTGLKFISSEAGFFVACDMPYLQDALIRHMVAQWEACDVVVPRVGWLMEPLHALYTRRCVGFMEEMIESGNHQIIQLFPKLRLKYVDRESIRAFDPELRCFVNVNRPEDLVRTGERGQGE